MVSAFQSREFGFGFSLTSTQLEIINTFRQSTRPHYTEAESATKLNGTTAKKELSESPFIIYFEYGHGIGKEGYWTYDHMALQFEDCVDCIQALYPDFDSVWTFDHSCGHDRGQEDGLVVGNMQTLWGGKQNKIRPHEIKEANGYLGPHAPKLQVGDFQQMVFQEVDEGPFYLSPLLRDLRRYDEIKGTKTKNRLKKDLSEELDKLGLSTRGKTMKEVQEMAIARNIPITIVENDVVEGWVGKPKGIKQVLWERGLLDPSVTYISKLKKKTESGWKGRIFCSSCRLC
jgi:hypothetical protein